jgi:hypothetical protein
MKKRISPGTAIGLVALFVALGGGAYAATSSDTKQDKKIANKAAKSYFNGHIGGASVSHASTAGSANSATNATNATNAGNANTVGGQTLTNVNVNVAENAQNAVYSNADGISVTVVCSGSGIPTINVNAPTDAELNWAGNDGSTNFGGLDANVASVPDDITSAHGRGQGTFNVSTNVPGHTLTGSLAWDDNPTHDGTFTGCSVWGTLITT